MTGTGPRLLGVGEIPFNTWMSPKECAWDRGGKDSEHPPDNSYLDMGWGAQFSPVPKVLEDKLRVRLACGYIIQVQLWCVVSCMLSASFS